MISKCEDWGHIREGSDPLCKKCGERVDPIILPTKCAEHTYHPDDGMCVQQGCNASKWDYSDWIAPRKRNIIAKGTAVMHLVEESDAPLENEIRGECNELADFLVDKNRKYGNSALDPVRIFSQSDVLEQLRVRIDDKLSRVKSAQLDEDEDVINDLIGYFILYRIKVKELRNND